MWWRSGIGHHTHDQLYWSKLGYKICYEANSIKKQRKNNSLSIGTPPPPLRKYRLLQFLIINYHPQPPNAHTTPPQT